MINKNGISNEECKRNQLGEPTYSQQKVEFSDDLTARTKSHVAHTHAEEVEVFSPLKSADTLRGFKSSEEKEE